MKAFDHINETFDRIFVVSLKRAEDRQERVRERLRGLRYEFFWGTDGEDLDVSALERVGLYSEERARSLHRHGKAMSLGHIGCSMSHRAIYEAVVRNGWRRVLVFEDDVLPRTANLPLLAPALGELPAGWDILYLGYDTGETFGAWNRVKQAAYLPLAALRLIKWTPRQVLGLHSRPFSPHLRRAGKHHGTHAYAVSQSGARHLLEAQTPVACNADQLLIRLCIGGEVEAFVTEPKFFDQESTLGSTGSYILDRGEDRLAQPWPHLRPRPNGSPGILPALRAARSYDGDAGLALGARADAGPAGARPAPAGGNGAGVAHHVEDAAEEPSAEIGFVSRAAEDRIGRVVDEGDGALAAGASSPEEEEVERIALPEAGAPE